MKRGKNIIVFLTFVLLLFILPSCNTSVSNDTKNNAEKSSVLQQKAKSKQILNSQQTISSESENVKISDIKIIIGEKSYTVKMYDNKAARELIERLPLTIEMQELNQNEKYYYFENKFSSNAETVKNIKTGELMLYGSDCLVLFYKDFPTTYNYTRLGFLEDATGLAEAVGKGNVTVTLKRQVKQVK